MITPQLIAEGNTDYALAETLCSRFEAPARHKKDVGRTAAIRAAGVFARTSQQARIVLLLDRNGHSPEECHAEVCSGLAESAPKHVIVDEGGWWKIGGSCIRLVLAGLPEDRRILELGIHRFTSDDYLLRLSLEDAALRSFCEGENHLSFDPKGAADLLATVREVTDTLRNRGVIIDTAKRYVHVIRAILGFEASRAEMMTRMIARCPTDVRTKLLGQLQQDLQTDPPFEQ